MAKSDLDQQTAHADSAGSAVASILRTSRIRNGGDLREIAAILCIRHTYLLAIEGGRFDDLPGATYAVGFVRAYADHLGLDGNEVARRFKTETEGLGLSTRLAFPIPMSEGRVPGGAMILLGAILGILVYGGWYWLSSADHSTETIINHLPNELVAALKHSPESSVAQSVPTPTPTAPAPISSSNTTTAVVTAAPSVATVTTAASPNTVTPPASPSKVAADTTDDQAEEASVPPSEEGQDETPTPNNTVVATPPVPVPPPAPAPITASPAPTVAATADPSAGRVFGDTTGQVRVVMRARGDSWIRVHDNGQIIATRVLRKGDSYRFPNHPGVTLIAGNVGALDVMVDNVSAPALGPYGKVRRNIAIDPDRLRHGTPDEGAAERTR